MSKRGRFGDYQKKFGISNWIGNLPEHLTSLKSQVFNIGDVVMMFSCMHSILHFLHELVDHIRPNCQTNKNGKLFMTDLLLIVIPKIA